MQAFRLLEWGSGPELVDVPEPEAGPGAVVIEVAGAGACHSDVHLMEIPKGAPMPWGPPFTLGHENAGRVHSLGAGVTGLEIGEPVAVYGAWGCGVCQRCRLGIENYCDRRTEIGAAGGGLGHDGGMAKLMLIPQARWLVPLGELDPVAAAPLTDAGLTPYHAIKRSLRVLVPGSFAVVIGAGGLGHMGIQFLRELSATTIIVVDQNERALTSALAHGAHHAVAAGADAAAEILSITRGLGAEAVFDFVSVAPTVALAGKVARSMGHITLVGIGGGALPVSFASPANEVSVMTTYWGSRPELHEVIALAAAGRIAARVTTFALEDAPGAYDAMRAGELDGRAVITP